MAKDILVNVHKAYRLVIAICDKDLYGRLLTEENKQLDLTGKFFEGKEMNKEEVIKEIERGSDEDANFNIVGKKSLEIAKEMGLVSRDGIKKIQGIPFALVLL